MLHTEKGGIAVLPYVFNMVFPTSPFTSTGPVNLKSLSTSHMRFCVLFVAALPSLLSSRPCTTLPSFGWAFHPTAFLHRVWEEQENQAHCLGTDITCWHSIFRFEKDPGANRHYSNTTDFVHTCLGLVQSSQQSKTRPGDLVMPDPIG